MTYFVTLEDFTPGKRLAPYDDTPWTQARIEEADPATPSVWAELETQALDPLDSDPTDPMQRSFSTPFGVRAVALYRVVFIDADGHEDISDAVGPRSGYPAAASLVAASDVSELTSLSAAQQEAKRNMAIAAVERYTGQRFTPFVGTLGPIDGHGARELYVPRRIEALTAISVSGTSLDVSDVVVDEAGDRIHFAPLGMGYAEQAMRETAYDSRTFRAGAGTVTLTGTFGWTVVPDAVVEAIRLEMEAQARADANPLAGTIGAYRRMGLTNIAQGNLRAQIGDPSQISPDAARMLADYIWTGAGGYLV